MCVAYMCGAGLCSLLHFVLTLSRPAWLMAEEKQKEVDSLIFQVIVSDKENLSHGLEEFEFVPEEATRGSNENVDSKLLSDTVINASVGQRQSKDIKLERYISQDDVPLTELPDKIPYFSGIPAVEVIKGIIHLYRDRSRQLKERTSALVCILGVPAHLSLSDLLKFLGPTQFSHDNRSRDTMSHDNLLCYRSTVKSIQVVRDTTPNQYMVILKFKNKANAEEFYLSYNMKRYSSFEKRVCQLVYISRIEIIKNSDYKRRVVPTTGITEVPSCSICLERLDDTVLTILCNHSFHTDCLTKWEDTTCPVCRYTQIPEISSESMCSTCDSKEDLWICLICGHVGCGRYLGGHAHEHFRLTQHTFSLQVGTQRVWDYIGDNYVHRLVQNKTDGKLIEIESGANNSLADDEKIDSLQLEYTYLLTSQLDSQRIYFEEKLERAEKDAAEQISVLKTRLKMVTSDNERLGGTIAESEKERKEKDKKITQLQTKINKLQSDLREEQELNKCMSDNQRIWRERVDVLENKMDSTIRQNENEILELKDQVKDLMFYMETQQKISDAPDEMKKELQEGHVIVTKSSEASATAKKSKRKGRHS